MHLSPIGAWALFRYDDVHRVLRDPHLSVEERHAQPAAADVPARPRKRARGDARGARQPHDAQPRPARPPPAAPARVEGVHAADDRGAARRACSSSSTSISTRSMPAAPARWTSSPTSRSRCRSSSSRRCSASPTTAIVTQLREWSGAIVKGFDPILTHEETARDVRSRATRLWSLANELVDVEARATPATTCSPG